MIHRLVATIARLLVSIFYCRVEVLGLERVPARGPLVVVANHHNALIDPALLLSVSPRIRSSPWLTGAIPVHRKQGAGASADARRNADMFARASRTLRRDRAILIFGDVVARRAGSGPL